MRRRKRNKRTTMPPMEDIILHILSINEALYDGQWSIGRTVWDEHKPKGYPTSGYILSFYGFPTQSDGWSSLIDAWVGVPVKTAAEINCEIHASLMAKRWKLDEKPDYTAKPDEHYLAATYSPGFAICEDTYNRTGRMMLR